VGTPRVEMIRFHRSGRNLTVVGGDDRSFAGEAALPSSLDVAGSSGIKTVQWYQNLLPCLRKLSMNTSKLFEIIDLWEDLNFLK
jgi:hypothetical protein